MRMLPMRALLTRPSFSAAYPVSCTVPRRIVRASCVLPTQVHVKARSVASLAQSDLRRVEGKLMQKYRPLAESMQAFHVSDDSLSEAIMESVQSLGSAEEQKRFDSVPAAPPRAAPVGTTPIDGFAKRGKSQEEMYIARAEAELLRKLRSKLAGMKKARESPSDRLKSDTGPRKASKSGSSPLQARQRGLEEDYIRRMEAEVLRKLREKKRAALEVESAAQESKPK